MRSHRAVLKAEPDVLGIVYIRYPRAPSHFTWVRRKGPPLWFVVILTVEVFIINCPTGSRVTESSVSIMSVSPETIQEVSVHSRFGGPLGTATSHIKTQQPFQALTSDASLALVAWLELFALAGLRRKSCTVRIRCSVCGIVDSACRAGDIKHLPERSGPLVNKQLYE